MACQIQYKGGKLDKVFAPNGEESVLFKGIGPEFGTTPGYSLRLWAQTYTPSFKSLYEGGYDRNGEAVLKDAKPLLQAFADEVRLSQDFNSRLQKVAEMYNMRNNGYFPPITDVGRLRASLKKHGLSGVSVKLNGEGLPYLTMGGAFYNAKKRHYYKSGEDPALRDFQVVQALNKLMDDLGVTVEWTDALEKDIIGRADVTNRLIELAEGKATAADATEEMLHVAVAMMRGTDTYTAMMMAVPETPAYREVQAEYIGRENYDERKMKEEAVVKHLRNTLLQEENLTWWDRLMAFLKRVFNRPEAISAFRRVASDILQQNISNLELSEKNIEHFDWRSTDRLDDVWYSLDYNAARQQARIDHFDRLNALTLDRENDRYVVVESGGVRRIVKMRVSDIVQKHARMLYGRSEFDPTRKKLLTTKGTILHAYNQFLMDHFMHEHPDPREVAAPNAPMVTIQNRVKTMLKSDPDFKGFADDYFNLTLPQFAELADGIWHLYKSIKTQDPAAVIRTEQFIYDPNRPEGSIGGTIDVLVIQGDGTMSLYDYKGVRLKRDKSGFLPVNDAKLQLWDIQIAEYKKILMDTMGVTKHDFRQTRVIPINTEYRNDSLHRLQMSRAGLNKAELDELAEKYKKGYIAKDYTRFAAVGNETVPGDVQLNNFLEKLYLRRDDLRGKMRRARGSERTRIERQLNRINNMVNEVLVYQDLQQPLESLKLMIHSIQNNVTKFSSGQLMSSLYAVEMFDSFQSAFNDTLNQMGNPEKEMEYRQMMKNYSGMLVQAKSALEQEIINRASMELGDSYDTPMNEKQILKGGKQKDMLGQFWEGAGTFNNPVLRSIMKLITEAEEKSRLKALGYERRINETTKAYLKWARSEGHGTIDGLNSFKPLIAEDGNLVRVYKKEFYETRNKMREEGLEKVRQKKDFKKELKWLEDHVQFNEEKWQEVYDRRKAELELEGVTKKEMTRELNALRAFNPKFSKKAYFQQRNYFLDMPKPDTDPVMAPYVSDEYKYIRSHKEALDYYNMFREITKDLSEIAGYDMIKPNQVANIRKTAVEHFGRLGMMGVGWREALEVRENDHMYGSVDQETGEPIRRIPIMFLDKITRNLTPGQTKAIRDEILAEGIAENSGQFQDEFERRSRRKMEELGVKDKSTDLSTSLKLWVQSVTDYEFKREIEDDVLMIRHVLETPFYRERPTDKFGRDLISRFERLPQERQGASIRTKDTVDKFINAHLYGQKVQGKDVLFGRKGRFVLGKGVKTIHSYLSAKALGLNPVLAGASGMNAMFNRMIMAERGIYFDKQSLKDAAQTAFTSSPKVIKAVFFFEPADKARDRALRASASKRKIIFSGRNLFALHRGWGNKWSKGQKELAEAGQLSVDDPMYGDDAVANKILIAMMKHWVIDSDGKIKSKGGPKKILDENAKSIWDAFNDSAVLEEGFEFSENNIPVEGLSFEEYNRFRRIVAEAQTKVKGTQTTDSYNTMSMTILGQAFMKFRTWMPGLVANRWEQLRYNPLLESWQEGYFRGGLREVMPSLAYVRSEQEAHATALGTLWAMMGQTGQSIANILREGILFGAFGGWKISDERAAFFRNRLLQKNPDINPNEFTLEHFKDYRRKQAKALIKEVRIYAGLAALVYLVLNAWGWDDEDEGNMASRFMYRLAQRTLLETSFFFSLDSVTEIVDSPLAAWRLVKDFSRWMGNMSQESAELVGLLEENNRDRTPLGYYTLKHLPVFNQIASLIGYFPAYQGAKGTTQKIFEESRFFEALSTARK